MQTLNKKYDAAIIGGGLGGLSLAIQLARANYSVVLFEKEAYPFHKVCGEYISMESWSFLESLGLPLATFHLPKIKELQLTAPNGKSFSTPLPLGGFGISRYKIDHLLSSIAKKAGVHLLEETKVESVEFDENEFSIQFNSKNSLHLNQITAAVCCGSFGKRSNIDVKWKRAFLQRNNPRTNNYIAVKYHIKTDWPQHLIGLHNFSNGYCGISKIEDDAYCLCYLTTAANLKKSGNSIAQMQQQILFKNPALKNIFNNSEFLKDFPLTISQISFSKKTLVENHLLMIGDAAGMITPLCGNGMSMALHSSKMAASSVANFLGKKISRLQMEENYSREWEANFAGRLKTGRLLQSFFGAETLSNLFVSLFKSFPFLAKEVIKKTHGSAF